MIDREDKTVVDNNNHLLSILSASLVCNPPNASALPLHCTTIADTGANGQYFMPTAPIININHMGPPIAIGITTDQCQHSSATALLYLPTLPLGCALLSHIMPSFQHNLLSIGNLCDLECTAIFTQFWVTIHNHNNGTILQGPRKETGSRLWCVNLRESNNLV